MKHLVNATITGVGGFVPEKVMTNFDFEKIVDTNDEWIRTRTGISERRFAEAGTPTSDLAVPACVQAMEMAGASPEEIDLIVVATITPDHTFPSTACVLQEKLGLKKAGGFDLFAACSGFLYALMCGSNFVRTGAYKKVLVVGAEMMSSILDFQDRNTCVLFGDGAAAAVVEPTEDEGIIDFFLNAEGKGAEYLYMPAGGSKMPTSAETVEKRLHYVQMSGREVFKFAVRGMAGIATNLLKRNNYTSDDLRLLIPHQANQRIIDSTQKALKLADEKVFVNIDHFGNTTAGSIPLCLWEAQKDGKLSKGDLILMVAFGAGFTSAGVLMRWGIG